MRPQVLGNEKEYSVSGYMSSTVYKYFIYSYKNLSGIIEQIRKVHSATYPWS